MKKRCRDCFNLKTRVLFNRKDWDDFRDKYEIQGFHIVNKRIKEKGFPVRIFFCKYLNWVVLNIPENKKARECYFYDGEDE